MAKKKKSYGWISDSIPNQDKQRLIDTLKDYWIPLLEQTLNQARRLLELLERDR